MSQARPAPTFAHAAEAFVLPGAWAPGTAGKYRQTFTALAARLEGTRPGEDLAALDTATGAACLAEAFTAAFGGLAAATRARHLSALRSAISWWAGPAGWLAGDPTTGWARPKVTADATWALTRGQVAALWRLDAGLRETALWRLPYETAARAEEILTLDITDLDTASKRARVVSKGGATEWVFWQSGAAHLLPRLLAGRDRGPVFLVGRRPVRAVPAADLCPVTGRARLSYRRAARRRSR